MTNQEGRFWNKIELAGGGECWLWTGATSRGYGVIWFDGKYQKSHRVAWQIAHGSIPSGMCVLHKCDVRHCCNPDHLFVGTIAENNADRSAKGRDAAGLSHGRFTRPERTPRGERHWNSKLSMNDIREIRQMISRGISQRNIAYEFDVAHSTIGRIYREENWVSK